MTDYSFFEDSCNERRAYRALTGWHCDHVKTECASLQRQGIASDSLIEVRDEVSDFDEEREECTVIGTHVMNPGLPTGVAAINERFGVELPKDFDDFYRRWDGGFLLFQEFYQLLPVDYIISFAEWMDGKNHETHRPMNFIRFCGVLDQYYLALRKGADDEWEVVFWEPGMAPLDSDCTGKVFDSFSSWLRSMCQNDGWPIGEGIDGMRGGDPPAVRLPLP